MTAATTITVTDEPGPVVERLKAETTARLAAILNDGSNDDLLTLLVANGSRMINNVGGIMTPAQLRCWQDICDAATSSLSARSSSRSMTSPQCWTRSCHRRLKVNP